MLARASPLLRSLPQSSSSPMARLVARAAASFPVNLSADIVSFRLAADLVSLRCTNRLSVSSLCGRRFHALCRKDGKLLRRVGTVLASQREYRKARRRPVRSKEKELELSVSIGIEDDLPDDPDVLSISELLRLNVPMAMKSAFDGLNDSNYKTRDTAIQDLGDFESVELSILLCNDEFIQKLNKEWRDEDHATDVLSMSQHIPGLNIPILMLGDIVVSVETAARQAEERGHTLLDEIRILMVHGLLHLLGFDHEISEEAEEEMEEAEELLLKSLGWKGKGLIRSACDADLHTENSVDRKKEGSLRFYKPKFRYIFCDMDGTMLNSKSQISQGNAMALREALSRGVKVVAATGKARPAAMEALDAVGLGGREGILSEYSPGVFLQGLLVYGREGREIFRRNLDADICREAFLYSCKNNVPLVAFCEDRCLTLFDHPLVDTLHTLYHESKAEIMPSVDHLLAEVDVQKLLFLDTVEGVARTLRPYWAETLGDRANVTQAVADILEIVPPQTSKGRGVRMLLDHLGVSVEEVMAIGDGENDVEMLELASLGVALSNGSEKAKAVAGVIGLSNDEDGVADAIYRYAF
ncbi:hypothetical protein SLE2022_187790 [Rubroshorea leprosula]